MSPSSYDPSRQLPLHPPTTSTWSSTSPIPPSPFPWATDLPPSSPPSPSFPTSQYSAPKMQREISSLSLSPAFNLLSPSLTGTGSKPMKLDVEKANSVFVNLNGGKLASVQGPKTPSGFEFLDWGFDAGDESSTKFKEVGRNFEWGLHAPSSPATPFSLTRASSRQAFKRLLGPTEMSYWLAARGEGVNDMYLHVGFKAPRNKVSQELVTRVWAKLIKDHSLLGAKIESQGIEEVRFVIEPPNSWEEVAEERLELKTSIDSEEIIHHYLNGPRTLSDSKLSHLIISTPEDSFYLENEEEGDRLQSFDVYLFSTHFLGDGMALHTTMNELFTLIQNPPPPSSPLPPPQPSPTPTPPTLPPPTATIPLIAETSPTNASTLILDEEEPSKVVREVIKMEKLVHPMEMKLSTPDGWGRFAWAGARVDFNRTQIGLIGGQAFPRRTLGPRKTLVPTISYAPLLTKKILTRCKSKGATIAQAVFALANFGFIRAGGVGEGKEGWPMMLYSALNLRPWLDKSEVGQEEEDWYHIAIGYYNIILPSFIPSSTTISPTEIFWHRAKETKKQTSKVVKSQFIKSRSKLMALERERRSIGFEREVERRKEGLVGLGIDLGEKEKTEEVKKVAPPATKMPSVALMGVSMLGNLDAMYSQKTLYPDITLHSLTTGSRQRPGALLLFAYTFAGKLWFSLGYDVNGFKEGVVEKWYEELQKGVQEFLLDDE